MVQHRVGRRGPVETVQDMKRRDSRPLRTLGSISLCRSLLEAGVVDRFRVVVFPVITGATERDRVFDGYPDIALEVVDSRARSTVGSSCSSTSHSARRAAWRR